MRTKSPAATTSMSDSATCTMTRRFPSENRLSPTMLRPCDLSASFGCIRVPRNAGAVPKTTDVRIATPAVNPRIEPLAVKLYNLPGGKGVALYLQGDNPVIIDHVVSGILTKISDPVFGYKLTFDVPADLQQPAPGAWATPLDFKVTIPARTIKKGSKKIPYIGTTGCPSTGIFTAKIETDNSDGTMSSVTTTAP